MRAVSKHGLSPMRQPTFEENIPEDLPIASRREREGENNEVGKLKRRIAELKKNARKKTRNS